MSNNLTTAQMENIVIGVGVLYIDYGELTERILAPVRGGCSFVVEQTIKEIEYDGKRGKTKGMRYVVEENATLTANIMDLSQQNIKLALVAATPTDGNGTITNSSTGLIADAEYFTNITLIGDTLGGDTKVIKLFNALSDGGLKIETKDKDEAGIELQFSAHYDPTDLTSPIYSIAQVSPVGAYTVTFTIDDGVNPVEGAEVQFDNRTILTNASGIAAFTNTSVGNNQPFAVVAGGYETYNASVNVVDQAVAATVSLTAI